jgi:hypothetical protein
MSCDEYEACEASLRHETATPCRSPQPKGVIRVRIKKDFAADVVCPLCTGHLQLESDNCESGRATIKEVSDLVRGKWKEVLEA